MIRRSPLAANARIPDGRRCTRDAPRHFILPKSTDCTRLADRLYRAGKDCRMTPLGGRPRVDRRYYEHRMLLPDLQQPTQRVEPDFAPLLSRR